MAVSDVGRLINLGMSPELAAEVVAQIAASEGGGGGSMEIRQFEVDLGRDAGTYDICEATGGNVILQSVASYCSETAVDVTGIVVQTDDDDPTTIMDASAGQLVAGTSLEAYSQSARNAPEYVISGKKIQIVITGDGTAGTMIMGFQYEKVGDGELVAI